jgi:aerobic-type carbon monoxide dehydrogenase small subunit (CoxS/CutS family)
MLVMARDIVLRLKMPGDQAVRQELSSQIYRTGYANIIDAVVAATREIATDPACSRPSASAGKQ